MRVLACCITFMRGRRIFLAPRDLHEFIRTTPAPYNNNAALPVRHLHTCDRGCWWCAACRCCSGRVVSVLEGGYNINGGVVSAFARSVEAHVRGLAEPHLKVGTLCHWWLTVSLVTFLYQYSGAGCAALLATPAAPFGESRMLAEHGRSAGGPNSMPLGGLPWCARLFGSPSGSLLQTGSLTAAVWLPTSNKHSSSDY